MVIIRITRIIIIITITIIITIIIRLWCICVRMSMYTWHQDTYLFLLTTTLQPFSLLTPERLDILRETRSDTRRPHKVRAFKTPFQRSFIFSHDKQEKEKQLHIYIYTLNRTILLFYILPHKYVIPLHVNTNDTYDMLGRQKSLPLAAQPVVDLLLRQLLMVKVLLPPVTRIWRFD